jgi:hypothetical protein
MPRIEEARKPLLFALGAAVSFLERNDPERAKTKTPYSHIARFQAYTVSAPNLPRLDKKV